MKEYETKDSGQRAEFANGFVRDTDEGKPNFGLLLLAGVPYQEQPLTRHAELLTRGSKKYQPRNWERSFNEGGVVPAESDEIERAKASAFRHMMQFLTGEVDEDHASAVKFNVDFVTMLRRQQPRREEAAPQTLSRGLAFNPGICYAAAVGGDADGTQCMRAADHEGDHCNELGDRFETAEAETFQECGAVARDGLGIPGFDDAERPCIREIGHDDDHRDQKGITWHDAGWCRDRMEATYINDEGEPTLCYYVCSLRRSHNLNDGSDHVWLTGFPVLRTE